MDREELVGIQTIWWVDYQLAVGFLTGSWKSNMDVWISNQLFGNPTACLSWPRCNGVRSHIASNVFRNVRPSPVGQQYVASLLQFCPKFSLGNLFSGSAPGWATKSTYAAAILQSLHRVYTLHSVCWQCWGYSKLLIVLSILMIVGNVHHCWPFDIGRKCLRCGRRRQFQDKHFETSCLYLGSSRL